MNAQHRLNRMGNRLRRCRRRITELDGSIIAAKRAAEAQEAEYPDFHAARAQMHRLQERELQLRRALGEIKVAA